MLKLPNVTLVAIGSTSIEGNKKALQYSSLQAQFGKVKFITHVKPPNLPDNIEFCKIEKITSIDKWCYEVVYNLGSYIDTEFALLVHPDGFVVHPEVWNDEWLKYDYIGAPFPLPKDNFSYRDINGKIQRVGNSVSLRSKKLLDLPKKIGMEWKPFHGFYNEDGYITVNMRHIFKEHGCNFAPLEVAKYFSREAEIPENKDVEKTFVFHKHKGRNKNYPNFEASA